MKKIVLTVAGALAILATSCVSLPDAARKLDLNVDSVTFANENNVEGFNVEYTVHHNSSAPMPIENVKIDIAINGKKAATYENDKTKELPNRVNNHFKVVVLRMPLHSKHKVVINSFDTLYNAIFTYGINA